MNLHEWRINDIERTANEAKRRLFELDSLRSDVGRLECALRDARAGIDGLRIEFQAHQEELAALRAELKAAC